MQMWQRQRRKSCLQMRMRHFRKAESEGFFTGMGVTYPWGSNMTITNKGMELLAAANLTGGCQVYRICAEDA